MWNRSQRASHGLGTGCVLEPCSAQHGLPCGFSELTLQRHDQVSTREEDPGTTLRMLRHRWRRAFVGVGTEHASLYQDDDLRGTSCHHGQQPQCSDPAYRSEPNFMLCHKKTQENSSSTRNETQKANLAAQCLCGGTPQSKTPPEFARYLNNTKSSLRKATEDVP